MSDIKSFLDELKQLNDKDCFNIFVPSINKKVSFKAFSVKQHRDIIKTMLEGVEGTISASKLLNTIIKENSTQDIEFKYYDRNKILLDIRRQITGDSVTIKDTLYSIDSLPPFNFTFKEEEEFEYSGITVKMKIPTLEEDSKITEKSVIEISKFVANDKKVGNSVSTLLIYELMKFIQSIQIEDTIINFSEQSTINKKNIIENLPLKLNNILLEFIAKYKEYEQEFFTFSDGTKLNIDASFLVGE
jgi:hypothetical protein